MGSLGVAKKTAVYKTVSSCSEQVATHWRKLLELTYLALLSLSLTAEPKLYFSRPAYLKGSYMAFNSSTGGITFYM